jgi:hypothetical protein
MSTSQSKPQGIRSAAPAPQPHPFLKPGGCTSPFTVTLAAAGADCLPLESCTTNWKP